MAIELDNAGLGDPGVAGSDPNFSPTETIIDPVTLLPFETQPLSTLVSDGFEGKPPVSPPATTQPQADAAAKDRYEYWQSQADKERNARLALEQELIAARPVMRLIEDDDELYKTITSRLDGAQPSGPALKVPTPPERPASFSETDAYTNPQSESFKFRVAREKYVEDRVDYLEGLQKQNLGELRQREAQLAEQAKYSRVLAQTEQLVQKQYGLSPADAREFTVWSSNDESVTIPTLVSFYKFLKAGGKLPGNSGGGPPAPPTRGGGIPPETVDANAQWNRAMFGTRKK